MKTKMKEWLDVLESDQPIEKATEEKLTVKDIFSLALSGKLKKVVTIQVSGKAKDFCPKIRLIPNNYSRLYNDDIITFSQNEFRLLVEENNSDEIKLLVEIKKLFGGEIQEAV